jgi:integrase
MKEINGRKPNGFGHTYKVGNSWKTVIRKDGRVVTAMAKNRAESRQKAKSKLLDLSAIVEKSSNQDSAAGPFFSQWLETEHKEAIAYSTYKRYSSLMRTHILPALGDVKLSEISRAHLSHVLASMTERKQSPRSQQQARALILIACKKAYEAGYIDNNPALGLRNIKVRGREISPLTIDEVKRLLATYEGTYMCARLHIALICGLRQGEALGLQWSHINWARNSLQVTSQIQTVNGQRVFTDLKTERSRRTVILTDETSKALKEHADIVRRMEGQFSAASIGMNLVFPAEDGTPRSSRIDYDDWHKVLRLCGIAPKRLHDARHTAATLMYSQGVGIETISRALGHSNSAITSRLYVHSAEEPLKVAAELMNSLIEK